MNFRADLFTWADPPNPEVKVLMVGSSHVAQTLRSLWAVGVGAPASQRKAGGGPCTVGMWTQAGLRVTWASYRKLSVGQDISKACLQSSIWGRGKPMSWEGCVEEECMSEGSWLHRPERKGGWDHRY